MGGMSLRGGLSVGNVSQARDHNYPVVSPEFKTDPVPSVSDTRRRHESSSLLSSLGGTSLRGAATQTNTASMVAPALREGDIHGSHLGHIIKQDVCEGIPLPPSAGGLEMRHRYAHRPDVLTSSKVAQSPAAGDLSQLMGGLDSRLIKQSYEGSGHEQGICNVSNRASLRGQGIIPGQMHGSVGGMMMDQPCITPPTVKHLLSNSNSAWSVGKYDWRMEFIESEQNVVTPSRPGTTPGHAKFESNLSVPRMMEGMDVALKSTLAPVAHNCAPVKLPTEIFAGCEECPSLLGVGEDESVTVYTGGDRAVFEDNTTPIVDAAKAKYKCSWDPAGPLQRFVLGPRGQMIRRS